MLCEVWTRWEVCVFVCCVAKNIGQAQKKKPACFYKRPFTMQYHYSTIYTLAQEGSASTRSRHGRSFNGKNRELATRRNVSGWRRPLFGICCSPIHGPDLVMTKVSDWSIHRPPMPIATNNR